MIQAILFGIGLSAATIIIHGIGTLWWINKMRCWQGGLVPQFDQSKSDQPEKRPRLQLRTTLFVLGFTSSLLVILHVIEVSIWALSYLMLPEEDSIRGLEEAFYFSVVTFSSLGFGDIVIQSSWRILSGIQAMAGNLAFGWSSALLLTTFLKMLESHRYFNSEGKDTPTE